jgi:hypothetical protein
MRILALILSAVLLASCAAVQPRVNSCPTPDEPSVGCNEAPCVYPSDPGVWLPVSRAGDYICAKKCCKDTQDELNTKRPSFTDYAIASLVVALSVGFGYYMGQAK